MDRRFRYAAVSDRALSNNHAHGFALSRTLAIYRPNAAYTYIPKNACSTLRFSLAIANGVINDDSQINWIHQNNQTFAMSTREAFLADYTFVILRCPYRRLLSAFMNKVVNLDVQAWQLTTRLGRTIHPHDLTFASFVDVVSEPKTSAIDDDHWRPQIDFLLYQEYDRYFCVEELGDAETALQEEIGLVLRDSRPLLRHDMGNMERVETLDRPYDLSVLDLIQMKREGAVPSDRTMYNDDLVSLLRETYRGDLDLYVSQFGSENLLFASEE